MLLGLAVAVVTTYGWYASTPSSEPAPSSEPSAPSPSSPPSAPPARPPYGAYTDYRGTVTGVSDGDTVRFKSGKRELRVRLDSIDAPEQDGGPKRPGQPHAQESQAHLQKWVQGKTLTARCFEVDRYDRFVCELLDSQGDSAGRAQVQAGYAWAYTAAQGRYLRDPALVALQEQARAAGRGLWQNRQVNAPWVWRYDCWREAKCAR